VRCSCGQRLNQVRHAGAVARISASKRSNQYADAPAGRQARQGLFKQGFDRGMPQNTKGDWCRLFGCLPVMPDHACDISPDAKNAAKAAIEQARRDARESAAHAGRTGPLWKGWKKRRRAPGAKIESQQEQTQKGLLIRLFSTSETGLARFRNARATRLFNAGGCCVTSRSILPAGASPGRLSRGLAILGVSRRSARSTSLQLAALSGSIGRCWAQCMGCSVVPPAFSNSGSCLMAGAG